MVDTKKNQPHINEHSGIKRQPIVDLSPKPKGFLGLSLNLNTRPKKKTNIEKKNLRPNLRDFPVGGFSPIPLEKY